MTNKQFGFSFMTGLAIVAFGGALAPKSTIGLSLMAVGAVISALALLTRSTQDGSVGPQVLPVQATPPQGEA